MHPRAWRRAGRVVEAKRRSEANQAPEPGRALERESAAVLPRLGDGRIEDEPPNAANRASGGTCPAIYRDPRRSEPQTLNMEGACFGAFIFFARGEPRNDKACPMAFDKNPNTPDDYCVIPWPKWYRSKGMSKDTARRLRKSGKGPRTVELSERLRGVTVKDDREWTEARIRDGA